MVNSNELYEFPRPTLAKVVNIGGIGVEYKDAKPLKGEFKKIAESGSGMVVMSFGSVVHAELMPEHWKTAFLNAFARFPQYEFLIRYASDDLKDRLPPNVHIHRWLPQTDLLQHPSTKAFISHGGYNSLQESINAGVPMISIALFGDQYKNSKIAAKHGFAVNLKKGTLDEASIVAALKEVLNNDTYSLNAKRLSLMVRKKPVTPTHLLVKWTEFLAEFRTLDNLTPAGNDLNFIQYFSLDVIGVLLLVISIAMYTVYKTIGIIIRKCCCRHEKEKKK
ncbi:UDP-glucoronosyl and UDP-glucosyl transferase [Ancylostoma caninum]|uniref:UDP-glucuronosyltransferase n=1 Tax=Ancylostoma caninum TaxID=29170 RepID=A0A368F729_ANCCA|nr:UDP-glucoronosyl and UDP-glucosyl transferase [Ancylostoma caninum]